MFNKELHYSPHKRRAEWLSLHPLSSSSITIARFTDTPESASRYISSMYASTPQILTTFLVFPFFCILGLNGIANDSIPLQCTATLAGHAILPANTFIAPPPDAPTTFRTSGKFTTKEARLRGITYISPEKKDHNTLTPSSSHEITLPFAGQPVQGFSGIKLLADNHYLVLTDNGFGSRENSSDSLLMFHHLHLDWQTNSTQVLRTIFLHDPDHLIPFKLVNENSDKRYLTGADLDPEGIQPLGELIWFSDEFGPYLFATDSKGRVVSFFETFIDSKKVISPDHHDARSHTHTARSPLQILRSSGFEGLAASYDKTFLYALLEGTLWDTQTGKFENDGGRQYLRILEFDTKQQRYTNRHWKYMLDHNSHRVGDFNMISKTRGLIIERDNGEGDREKECKGSETSDCFQDPAQFKRIYLIELTNESGGPVRKVAYLDLLNIRDPYNLAVNGSPNNGFTFPFITVENVDRVDEHHIIVANDNNLPFSSGRSIGSPDNTEFILLHVGEMFTTP